MNAANPSLPMPTTAADPSKLLAGLAVGLLAASIGALYTVFARWGIAHGLQSPDLTVLRFGVAGVLTLPVLWWAWRRDAAQFTSRWRVWALVALLAGTPFGLLMFGALQFAPASHAAVFPFTAMSVMGMVLGAVVLGERLRGRESIDCRQRRRGTRVARRRERSGALGWRAKCPGAPSRALQGLIQGDFSLRTLLTRPPGPLRTHLCPNRSTAARS